MISLRSLPKRMRALVIAPSAPGGDMDALAVSRAFERLDTIGISCRISPNLNKQSDGLAVPPEHRIADFTHGLLNPDIDLLIALYGGYSSIDLLENLPYDLWRKTRKPLLGFSDITALHLAGWTQCGLPGLHGPNLSNFGAPDIDCYTLDQLESALNDQICRVGSAPRVAEDIWYDKNASPSRSWHPHELTVFQPGKAFGTLIGGNLATLMALSGTKYFPSFEGAIIFIECNNSTNIREIDRDLTQLKIIGGFEEANAVLFCCMGHKNETHVSDLVEKHLQNFSGPILGGIASSHLDPIATLAIGSHASVDTSTKVLEIFSPFDLRSWHRISC